MVPLEAAGQLLPPANPFLYEEKSHPSPCGHEWVKGPQVVLEVSSVGHLLCQKQPGWSSAGLSRAPSSPLRARVLFLLLLGNLGKESQGMKIIPAVVLKGNYCRLCQNVTRIKAQLRSK